MAMLTNLEGVVRHALWLYLLWLYSLWQEEYVRGEANPNPPNPNPNPTPNQEEYVRGEAPLNFKVSLDDGNEYVPHYSFQSGGQGSALLASEGPRTDGPTPGELRAMRGDALGALVTWEAVKGSKVGDGL
eukprot:scaffold100940_cov51-Phaeocystis_antarctica.AAC.1